MFKKSCFYTRGNGWRRTNSYGYKRSFQDPHLETVGWENFLGMTVGQAVVWASQNIDPKYTNPEFDNIRTLCNGISRYLFRSLG